MAVCLHARTQQIVSPSSYTYVTQCIDCGEILVDKEDTPLPVAEKKPEHSFKRMPVVADMPDH